MTRAAIRRISMEAKVVNSKRKPAPNKGATKRRKTHRKSATKTGRRKTERDISKPKMNFSEPMPVIGSEKEDEWWQVLDIEPLKNLLKQDTISIVGRNSPYLIQGELDLPFDQVLFGEPQKSLLI